MATQSLPIMATMAAPLYSIIDWVGGGEREGERERKIETCTEGSRTK